MKFPATFSVSDSEDTSSLGLGAIDQISVAYDTQRQDPQPALLVFIRVLKLVRLTGIHRQPWENLERPCAERDSCSICWTT